MPEDFERCRREGGRIRTKKLSKGRYLHICWDKSGKSHAGEVKQGKVKMGKDGGRFRVKE